MGVSIIISQACREDVLDNVYSVGNVYKLGNSTCIIYTDTLVTAF